MLLAFGRQSARAWQNKSARPKNSSPHRTRVNIICKCELFYRRGVLTWSESALKRWGMYMARRESAPLRSKGIANCSAADNVLISLVPDASACEQSAWCQPSPSVFRESMSALNMRTLMVGPVADGGQVISSAFSRCIIDFNESLSPTEEHLYAVPAMAAGVLSPFDIWCT